MSAEEGQHFFCLESSAIIEDKEKYKHSIIPACRHLRPCKAIIIQTHHWRVNSVLIPVFLIGSERLAIQAI